MCCNKLSDILSILSLLLLMMSCYTATESTPRIKVSEVGNIVKTEEELIMENNFLHQGCHTWQPGKAFAYVDDKLSPVLIPEGKGSIVVDGLKGKIFYYEGYKEDNTYGIKPLVTLIFSCDSMRFTHATGKSLAEIEEMNYQPLIPSFVDIEDVAMARLLFEKKKLYILSNQWYDADGELFTGRRYIPVVIDSVLPGNNVLPLSLMFTDDKGRKGRVFMSIKSSAYTQILTFDRLFSFTNPRNRYPQISDTVWTAITEGRLLKGMTKDECKLSVGLPAEIKKIPTYSGLQELWLYNTGAYLLFSDGILDSFR